MYCNTDLLRMDSFLVHRSHGSLVGKALPYWSSSGPEFEPRLRPNLLNRKRGSNAHNLSLSSAHRPDITEILLKRV